MDNLKEVFENMKQAIVEIKEKVPQRAGERLAKEVPHVIERAMTEFYFSYAPEKYNRTLGLYNGISDGVFCSIDRNKFELTVSSDMIPDHKHDSGEYIFNGAFEQGIHGTSEIFVSTPPWKIYEPKLEKMYENFIENELDKILSKI